MPDALASTPGQTIGPFFHFALPYERSNLLVAPASPGAVRLHGLVYDGRGAPVPDALIEIRQADASGRVPTSEGSLDAGRSAFTGWGRCATDAAGHYSFTTVEPGGFGGAAGFFAMTVFARGLLDRLFTRVYMPGADAATDPLLASLDDERRGTLVADRDGDGSLRFDVRIQGDRETVFLTFPGHLP